MPDLYRQNLFIFIVLIVIGLILLAAGFPGMELKPGRTIPVSDVGESQSSPSGIPAAPEFRQLIKFPLAIFFVVIVLLIFFYFLRRIHLKHLLLLFGGLVILIYMLYLINQIKLPSTSAPIVITQDVGMQSVTPVAASAIVNPPENLFTFVIIGLCLLAFATFVWLFFRTTRQANNGNPLADEAGQAVKAFHNGECLGSVIIRCYLQMEKTLIEEEGIQRGQSLTPREFERLLIAKGLSISQIHELTRLFEQVRYGKKTLDPEDEQTAINCLTGIQNSFTARKTGH